MEKEEYFTVEQVSKRLQIHWQSVLNYIKSGKLRALKLGRGYRIDPKDLAEFIEKMKTKV